MNKATYQPITKTFTKGNRAYFGMPVWTSGKGPERIEVCRDAIDKLWDIPRNVKTIEITAYPRKPDVQDYYIVRRTRDFDYEFTTPYGLFWNARELLNENFGSIAYIVIRY